MYVLLDLDNEASGEQSGEQSGVDPVQQMLREQNQMLREQLAEAHAANRENRRIIAALTQRIPELEAPPEPRESPVSGESAPYGTSPQEAEESLHRRSWWRRLFGA